MTQNYLTLADPVQSSQHAGLMHPFRYTTCTKHDSAYCNVTHRGRVWLHISRKMDDNSVVLWRHLPIKELHFSHPHIVPCLVCVTVYIIALMCCASFLIACRDLSPVYNKTFSFVYGAILFRIRNVYTNTNRKCRKMLEATEIVFFVSVSKILVSLELEDNRSQKEMFSPVYTHTAQQRFQTAPLTSQFLKTSV